MSWKCPQCASTNLNVDVIASAKLIQKEDGTFETKILDGDHEWSGDSTMSCADCQHSDGAISFATE